MKNNIIFKCPKCNSSLFHLEVVNNVTVVRCWKKSCGFFISNDDYKIGFKDGIVHAKGIVNACLSVNASFYDILATMKLRGDNAMIFDNKTFEDKNDD